MVLSSGWQWGVKVAGRAWGKAGMGRGIGKVGDGGRGCMGGCQGGLKMEGDHRGGCCRLLSVRGRREEEE